MIYLGKAIDTARSLGFGLKIGLATTGIAYSIIRIALGASLSLLWGCI